METCYTKDQKIKTACIIGNVKIVEKLIKCKNSNNNTLLCNACLHGKLDVVKILIANGAHVTNNELIASCIGGNIDIVKLLLNPIFNLDINSRIHPAFNYSFCYNKHMKLNCCVNHIKIRDIFINSAPSIYMFIGAYIPDIIGHTNALLIGII